jgi:uncharacterized membrane protein YfcA
MEELILVALAGFLASFVDGALGMGFGPTSSSILLASGFSPAASAATVNLAKVATGFSAALAHWRFRNTDHRLVLKLAVPGALGAVLGVTILANVDGDTLKPVLAVVLLLVAVRILLRFSNPLAGPRADSDDPPVFDEHGMALAAATGGVTNGLVGAWGPVVTPFLLHRGLPPRYAIGSVNTAEVAVAVVSAGTLLGTIGGNGVEAATVVAMLIGGVIASPLAAWLIRFLPARALGVAVGGFLLVTNLRALADWADVGGARWVGYLVVAVATTAAALRPRLVQGRQPVLDPA